MLLNGRDGRGLAQLFEGIAVVLNPTVSGLKGKLLERAIVLSFCSND
jgi:hypothetical protein